MSHNLKLVIGNKNYSSWSLRGWLVAKQSGLPFEEVFVPLDAPDYKSLLRAHSEAAKVPVLKDGDLLIWDTLAIAEYLAEQVPDLWPQKAQDRAWARSISAEMHSGFPTLRSSMPMNCRAKNRKVPITATLREEIERVRQIWNECLAAHAQQGPWLFGVWSIADAMFAPVVMRLLTYDVDVDESSRVYMKTTLDLPVMKEWLEAAEAEQHVMEQEEVGVV